VALAQRLWAIGVPACAFREMLPSVIVYAVAGFISENDMNHAKEIP
jgi:hypothetical protein